MNSRFIIALIGEKAAGKGTAALLFRKTYGARVMRFSDPIRAIDILERTVGNNIEPKEVARFTQSLLEQYDAHEDLPLDELYRTHCLPPPTTDHLRTIGNLWRKRHGGGILTSILLDVAGDLSKNLVVIDGVRNPAEIEPLRKRRPAEHALFAVRADKSIREQRFLEGRKRAGDPATRASFVALDNRDKGKGEGDDGQQLNACLAMVGKGDTIWNNQGIAEFEAALQVWFEKNVPSGIIEKVL